MENGESVPVGGFPMSIIHWTEATHRSWDSAITDGDLSDYPNLVSQVSKTEAKQKQKDKESDLDIEMIGVSESGGGHGNVTTRVDTDTLKDVSMQAVDEVFTLPH